MPTRWEAIDWWKTVAKDTFDKGSLTSKNLKPNRKMNKTKKWAEDLDRHFTKDLQRVNLHMENASHHMPQTMQIKTSMSCHCIPISTAKINNNDTNKCCRGCGATGTPIRSRRECKVVHPHWEAVWWFLTKQIMFVAYDVAIVLLGIYPKELKTYAHAKSVHRCL